MDDETTPAVKVIEGMALNLKGVPSDTVSLHLGVESFWSINIKRLRVRPMREGLGSQVLSKLCELADVHGVSISLIAQPLEKSITLEDLKRFYSGFGFREVEHDLMVRDPK